MFLKSVNSKFFVIAGLLLLLFGCNYALVVMFQDRLSAYAIRSESASQFKAEIWELEGAFWSVRYWESASLAERSPEATQRFFTAVKRMHLAVARNYRRTTDPALVEKLRGISVNLDKYESVYGQLIQLRSRQRLNLTRLGGSQQRLIAEFQGAGAKRAAVLTMTLSRLQNDYLATRDEAALKALRQLLTTLPDTAATDDSASREQLIQLADTYRVGLETDFSLLSEARSLQNGFDGMSQNLAALFLDASTMATELARQETAAAEDLRAQLQISLLILTAVGLLVLLGVLRLTAGTIIRPIAAISHVVKEIRSGRLETRYRSDNSGDDIDLLGLAFNDMLNTISSDAVRLKQYQNELEVKVQALSLSDRELRKHQTQLEELVGQRTVELKHVVDELRQEIERRRRIEEDLRKSKEMADVANRAKSEFLSTMSHEIRTPLNGIIGMTSLISETALTAEQQDHVATIRSSCDILLTLINDILDYSKIESGRMELENEPFDLRNAVEDSMDVISKRAAEKGLNLAYSLDPKMPLMYRGDVTRLRQVLVNLLGNAVKFTECGEVVLEIGTDTPIERPDGWHETIGPSNTLVVHVRVRDTGIGIPRDRMDRLFQSFSQVDASMTRKFGGTGLGLAICKRIVEMMGGRIWVESEVNKGSTFHVRVPLECVPAGALPAEDSLLLGKRLLIVDDNETMRNILRVRAEHWGMNVSEAADARSGLAWLEGGTGFDLVIVELQMPGMDGMAFAREVRARLAPMTLPVVLLTPLGFRPENVESIKSLITDYLYKPVRISLLHDVLAQAIDGRKANDKETLLPKKPESETPVRSPLRVLLAEDNVVNQKVAVQILRRMGYEPDVASNGLEAVEACGRQRYDLVFMDVQMPEMDGLEAARRICSRWPVATDRPKIIAMTANVMQGDREKCHQAGMDDYVPKPIRADEIARAISRVMANTASVPDAVPPAAA